MHSKVSQHSVRILLNNVRKFCQNEIEIKRCWNQSPPGNFDNTIQSIWSIQQRWTKRVPTDGALLSQFSVKVFYIPREISTKSVPSSHAGLISCKKEKISRKKIKYICT